MADEPSLKPSRPTLAVDGTDSASLTGGLLRLRVRSDVHGLSNCEAEFGNWGPKGDASDFIFFDRSLLDFGKELKVKVGTTALFSGKITALEARYPQGNSPSLVVLAEDRFQDLRMTRRTRTFADVSDSDVFSQIAGDHGLTPSVGVSGPTHKVLAQVNQSDLAFLRERARALDAELWISDSTMNVKPRSSRGGTPFKLTYGKELRELRVLADLAGQATSLEVTGWDVSGKQAVTEKVDGSVVSSELAGGDSGPTILRSAFGDRKDALANAVPQTGAEAHARAEALLKRRARRFLVGHGTSETRAELQVGATITLAGVGPLFNGDFYLAATEHIFDGAQGLWTELELERPGLGEGGVTLLDDTLALELRHSAPGARWYGIYPALVKDIADPDGQGRVKVSLPWAPDLDGGSYEAWARLGTMMGGSNRGTWFVPDKDDEVVVGFEGGDPRRPYVLGGLWNGSDSPPETMDGGGNNYKKVICSRNGVKITLDDTDGQEQLMLETPGGQKVTLKDGPGAVTIEDSNGNSVKLESAGITVTASAKVTVNASTAEISAGMLTVNAGMSKFSGVVQADTVIANSVVGSSYTPGAGNIW